MNRKYLFAGLVSFAALPCFGEVPMEISLLMKDGEFAKAGSLTVRGEIFFENNWLTIW